MLSTNTTPALTSWAGGPEVAVVGAVLLLAVDRDLGRVHIQHYPLWRIDGFDFADEFAVDAGQTAEVLLLGQDEAAIRRDTRPLEIDLQRNYSGRPYAVATAVVSRSFARSSSLQRLVAAAIEDLGDPIGVRQAATE